jgi:hypothetical protein
MNFTIFCALSTAYFFSQLDSTLLIDHSANVERDVLVQKLCVPVNLLIAFSILRVSCAGTDEYRNLIEDDVCIA